MRRRGTSFQGARRPADLPCRVFCGILGLSAAATVVQAGEIYKSYDANGNVVYSDHLDSSQPPAGGVQLVDSGLPPPELHLCWTNCFRLILDNGEYRRTDGTDETWTVETFTSKSIVLHRHDAPADWNGFSRDVVYAGQVSHDRLLRVTVDGKPISGIDASWGTALNTLPGSNAERDGNFAASPSASSGAALTAATAPPPPPAEEQPVLSEDGYLWTPGYWSWRIREYVWIPGVWLRPPRVGDLWTPSYWALAGGVFVFHRGHWGSSVGFYGGVNYGHGYSGTGYSGGHWVGNTFAYNSAVNHLNPAVAHRTYAEPMPDPGSRRLSARAGGPPAGNVAPPATTGLVPRSRAPTPNPGDVNKPAGGARTPAPGASERFKRTAPIRTAPTKP